MIYDRLLLSFKTIPKCVYELANLAVLRAKDNKVEQLDVSALGMAALTKLTVLDMSNNSIGHVPPQLGLLSSIW